MYELQSKEIVIDGVNFRITQFPGRKCLLLEKNTITILSPLVNLLKGAKSLDDSIDFGEIAGSIKDILENLDDVTYMNYLKNMFANTHVIFEKGVECLAKDEIMDMVFINRGMVAYKLLLEIMKFNKFAFFGLMGGEGLPAIDILSSMKQKKKAPSKK